MVSLSWEEEGEEEEEEENVGEGAGAVVGAGVDHQVKSPTSPHRQARARSFLRAKSQSNWGSIYLPHQRSAQFGWVNHTRLTDTLTLLVSYHHTTILNTTATTTNNNDNIIIIITIHHILTLLVIITIFLSLSQPVINAGSLFNVAMVERTSGPLVNFHTAPPGNYLTN